MAWAARFPEPIALPEGGKLATLQDAGAYITRLPRDAGNQGVAERDACPDPGGRPWRADRVRASRHHTGAVAQRDACLSLGR
jgi:hypothetical protein